MNCMQKYTYKALRKYRSLAWLLLAGFAFTACEIEEEDLENDWVQVIVPRDLLETDMQTVDFVWEALDGADDYQLQIARPSFLDTEIEALLVDTITTATRFAYTFSPGKYEWRIRARNSSSMTYYRKRLMKIDSATSLVNQRIILRSPVDGAYSNEVRPTFKWEELSIAEVHRFQIYEGVDFDGNPYTTELSFNNGETSTELPIDFIEGSYSWGVRGEETFSNTPYSTRVLHIDLSIPTVPTLSVPLNNAIINGTNAADVEFKWTVTSSGLAPEFDSLEIYKDSLLSGDSLLSKHRSTVKNVVIDTLVPGDYYWRVKRIDAAGNASDFSNVRKVIVN